MVVLVALLLMVMVVTTSNGQQPNGQRGTSFCHFPFIYKGVSYSDCTTVDDPNGQLWCSTKTDNQNNHIKGNFIPCTGNYKGPSYCRFPFIHNSVTYSSCTKIGDPNDQFWCSTKTDNQNNHLQGNFRHCISEGPPMTSQRSAVIPTEEECGQSWRDNVVAGELTSAGDWPWLAALGIRDGTRFSAWCGGTLITKQHVISAAHCFLTTTFDNTIVRLGEYDLNIDGDGVQDFKIVDQRVANYNEDTKKDDIILLKLDRPLSSFTDSIRAACLPYHLRNDNLEGNDLTVVGWGKFNTRISKNSPVPLQGDVSVVPVRDCLEIYKDSFKIDNSQLCAGTGGTDSCNGDSGGPLNFLDHGKARFYVVGIVSFGPSICGSSNRPGVYTRIVSYLDWIENSIKQIL